LARSCNPGLTSHSGDGAGRGKRVNKSSATMGQRRESDADMG
jgi:hypothetical protein